LEGNNYISNKRNW